MKLIIIEGLDKTGKTTYTKNKFMNYNNIRLPGGSEYSQDLRKYFLEGKIPKYEIIHILYGEHMAVLEKLIREEPKNYVLDRSFISFLVYQKDFLKEFGYYDTYKKLLEDKFSQVTKVYDVEILYFHKRLSEKKDDWLECMDIDQLKHSFEEILKQSMYENYIEYVDVELNS